MKKIIFLTLLAMFSVGTLSAQEERIFQEAERRFYNGDYQFALSRYTRLIEEYPNSEYVPDAKFREAVIFSYLGENEKALALFSRVIERYSFTRYYRHIPFWLGYNSYQLAAYQDALEYFEEALDEGAEAIRRDTLFYKGLSERALGRREAAFESAHSLFAMYERPEEDSEMLLLYTSLLVETGRFQNLYELYSEVDLQLLDMGVRHQLALYRAEALFHQAKDEEAEPIFRELLSEEDEVKTTAYKRLFVLYGRNGMEEKQQEIFDEAQSALANKPALLAEFLLRAGIQHYKEGEYELARSYLRRIWRTNPLEEVDGLVPLYLAQIMEKNGELEEAGETIREFLLVSSDRRKELLFTLARLESSLQRWDRTVETAEIFLQEYPESEMLPQINYLYAYALYRSGKLRQSLTVVQESFATGITGDFDRELLRLRSRLYASLDRPDAAIEDLREYLPKSDDNGQAAVDLAKLYFLQKEYDRVHELLSQYTADESAVSEESGENPASVSAVDEAGYHKLVYIDGVAALKQKDYQRALDVFGQISKESLSAAGLDELIPHYLFYAGWSEYRTGNYSRAGDFFGTLVENYPRSDRAAEAYYLKGWSAYVLEEYIEAREAFGAYSQMDVSEDAVVRGLFMYAKSSAAIGKENDALMLYQTIYREHQDSDFADDALYEYAAMLNSMERPLDAVDTYQSLYKVFPTSPLAEEALYRRGEILFQIGNFAEARDAFYEQRIRFPQGNLVDESLYWSGRAALEAGQPYGSVLVWEKLVQKHPESGFLDEVLLELARLYTDLGEYQQAVSYYTEYISAFPDQTERAEAEQQIATLKRIIGGQSSREAELSVQIEQEGFDSPDGRAAALELAKMYLYQYPEKNGASYEMLQDLLDKKDQDPGIAAQAQYLIGEYHRKRGDFRQAANAYVGAAVLGSGDDDLVARSLLKAAQTAAEAGDSSTARRMVQKLRSDFPQTQWSAEGESLLRRLPGSAGDGE